MIAANVICYVLMLTGTIPTSIIPQLVLHEWSLSELISYQFVHAGFLHLLFNMIYLWVFGNAVCAVMNLFLYPSVYLLLGVAAGAIHMAANGSPVVGASGAISGIMGLYLAIYPTNKISCVYWFMVRTGTFEISGYLLILFWFAVDLFNAFEGAGQIAYWSHVGGIVSGFIVGILCLKLNLIERTEVDLPSILELSRKS
jgi:membrane associated rhomboid family serine protease